MDTITNMEGNLQYCGSCLVISTAGDTICNVGKTNTSAGNTISTVIDRGIPSVHRRVLSTVERYHQFFRNIPPVLLKMFRRLYMERYNQYRGGCSVLWEDSFSSNQSSFLPYFANDVVVPSPSILVDNSGKPF